MRATLLYSSLAGKGKFSSKIPYILRELKDSFESIEVESPLTKEEAFETEKNCDTDVLIVCGGDGTFNNAINAIAERENKPILAYINAGTLGDMGKNFGINKSLRRSLDIIKKGCIKECDISSIEVDGVRRYFTYMCANGVFSDIPYRDNKGKKQISFFSYYFKAIKDLFKREKIVYKYNGKEYKTPFLLFMKGKFVASFPINPSSKMDDGKISMFISKGKAFQSLLPYFFRFGLEIKKEESFDIKVSSSSYAWCVDGEEFLKGDAKITAKTGHFRVFCKNFSQFVEK